MMNYDNEEMRNGFRAAFGFDISEPTVGQAWWLVKVIKHCRGRCRNNSALNNYLERNLTGLKFQTVSVVGKNDEEYDTLKITGYSENSVENPKSGLDSL